MALRCKTDLDKPVITVNFERRGWKSADGDDWNFYWASSVRQFFSGDKFIRLNDAQVLNHFPNHYELTRKDLMVKNINKYRRELEKSGQCTKEIDFLPQTYSLPIEMMLFQEEFKRRPNSVWIMKPSSKARGVGIFMVNKLSQIRQWAKENPQLTGKDVFVVSQYIDRPLLIGGRKFDLRMYILVTSYAPLTAYKYDLGFARFCTAKYSMANIDDMFVHLTNVSIQQKAVDYNEDHGGKWSLKNLGMYVEGVHGHEVATDLWHRIDRVIFHSLKACQSVILNDKHCFECYGYDILIDENLKPWLIEVNASPSLSATTATDFILKSQLIGHILDVVMPQGFPAVNKMNVGVQGWKHGFFKPLIDEGGRCSL